MPITQERFERVLAHAETALRYAQMLQELIQQQVGIATLGGSSAQEVLGTLSLLAQGTGVPQEVLVDLAVERQKVKGSWARNRRRAKAKRSGTRGEAELAAMIEAEDLGEL